QYEIPLQIEPFAVSGVWGKLWGADQLSDELVVTLPENSPEPPEADEEAMAPLDDTELDTEVALSPEEITDVKDTISEEDKQVVFETLMTKLPPEVWQVFSTYTEDGL